MKPFRLLGSCFAQPEVDWKQFLPPNYNKTAPLSDGNSLEVTVTLTLESITSISESKLEFYADMRIILKWFDHRLGPANIPYVYSDEDDNYLLLPVDIRNKIWHPKMYIGSGRQDNRKNLYIKDGKESQLSYFLNNQYLEMHTNPNIRIFCSFQFHNFPFDVQHCPIRLQFDLSTKKGVYAVFDDTAKTLLLNQSPSTQLDVNKVIRKYCTDHHSVGNFSCLELRVTFRRLLSTHISQTFIPSTMIVVLSWFSFWLDVEAAPARISLGVTALLTLSTSFAQNQRTLPAVAYMKAIDLWMFFCLFYVFMTLVEFTVAYTINRKSKDRKNKEFFIRKQIVNDAAKKYVFTERRISNNCSGNKTIFIKKAKKISLNINLDQVARIVFPLFFVIFVLTFLIYYVRIMQKKLEK